MFPAGVRSGTACPSGSQYKGSGFCKAKKPDYQFFRAGGSSGTSCPSGSQYKGNGFCLSRWYVELGEVVGNLPFLCPEGSCCVWCWRSYLTKVGTPWVIMLMDWCGTSCVMRTVPGGQALLGLFLKTLTAPTAGPALRWWWFLLVFCPRQHFQFIGGDIDTVPLCCVLKVPSEPAWMEVV
jgi:hypothetical protein